MTQVFDNEGKVRPGTVLLAEPNVVLGLKNKARDGYGAVLVGAVSKDVKRAKKPQLASIKKATGKDQAFRYLQEFRLDISDGENAPAKVGDEIDVTTFSAGDKVVVTGTSKGKGFQGVVKRHGFHGGPRSHGQKHSEREPGSIGSTGPQRVFKGVRMAGRMGSDRVSVKGLKILAVDKESNQILVSGAVPGRRGTLVSIKSVN